MTNDDEDKSEWTPREHIFAEKIEPLVQRVFALCEQHEIPIVAQFCFGKTPDDGHRVSSLFRLERAWETPFHMAVAASVLDPDGFDAGCRKG